MELDQYFFTLDGQTPRHEPDMEAWNKWMSKGERHVARDEIGKLIVSTVFLGMNHNFGYGPPVLFETMIFGLPDEVDEYQERYVTWDEAVAGHARAMIYAAAENKKREN